jgi:hypothetical protein
MEYLSIEITNYEANRWLADSELAAAKGKIGSYFNRTLVPEYGKAYSSLDSSLKEISVGAESKLPALEKAQMEACTR